MGTFCSQWKRQGFNTLHYVAAAFNPVRHNLDTPYSLGIRKFLVVLKYEAQTLVFSIKSDEAQYHHEAVRIALARVHDNDDRIGKIELGRLLEEPSVTADTEGARDAAGITDIDYPETYPTPLTGRWYNAKELVAYNHCRVCKTPITSGQRLNGGTCEKHRPIPKPKPGRPETVSLAELEMQSSLVRELGSIGAAAKSLGVSERMLSKRMKKARGLGISTQKKKAAA